MTENGLFIRGVVISNSARKITKKDGGILALVKHELALQPGVAVLERFLDPKDNPEVEINGDEVTKYPELKAFQPVSVKATRIQERNGQISSSSWEIVD
ncbi:hypothetical protein DDZ13_07430 [Coraliomargarita sinensis]|uniref:Uncharacterized protein n=1 Tax=Coraliomargarita sinensis TaxID=2174842 RepID=A0A317ZFK7_9BACT|nr:hypothetical protein DDZ13_07430 [Coraliomargarita sinensis]